MTFDLVFPNSYCTAVPKYNKLKKEHKYILKNWYFVCLCDLLWFPSQLNRLVIFTSKCGNLEKTRHDRKCRWSMSFLYVLQDLFPVSYSFSPIDSFTRFSICKQWTTLFDLIYHLESISLIILPTKRCHVPQTIQGVVLLKLYEFLLRIRKFTKIFHERYVPIVAIFVCVMTDS